MTVKSPDPLEVLFDLGLSVFLLRLGSKLDIAPGALFFVCNFKALNVHGN